MRSTVLLTHWTRTVNLLLLTNVFQCGGSEGLTTAGAGSVTNLTVGESVLFPVTPEGNHSYRVKLNFKSFLVFSWSYGSLNVLAHNKYEKRVSIKDRGFICLSQLQLNDSGTYDLDITYLSGKIQQSSIQYHLQVFESVSKPNITAECVGHNVSLRCSTSQGSHVTYLWESLPSRHNSSVQLGPEMVVELPGPPLTYSCTAQNQVSSGTSDPLDLGVCPHQSPELRWIAYLCATMFTMCFIGALVQFYRSKRREGKTHLDAQPSTDDMPLVIVSSIEPVYIQDVTFRS